MRQVKLILAILACLVLAPCASVIRDVDTILDTTPEPSAAAGWLVGQLGLSKPVLVTDGELLEMGMYGMTQNLGDLYLVTLDWRLDPHAKVMVLVHELAHAVHWERGGGTGGDHGKEWGEAYAEVFRVWVGED